MSLIVGIIGATVMPHVVYLHSALHKHRVIAASPAERRLLLTSNKWDCALGLGAAGLVNLAMLCVAAAAFGHGVVGGHGVPGGHGGLAPSGDFTSISGRLAAVAGAGRPGRSASRC